MIIFLYGQDSYRLNKEAKSIIEKYNKKHSSGVNLFSFDFETEPIQKAEDAIKTMSFFDEVKLVVLKNTFTDKKTSDSFHAIVRGYDLINNKDVVLLVKEAVSGKDLKTKNEKLFTLLVDKKNLSRNFEIMDARKLEDWVKREFQARDCSISTVLAKRLISLVGDDTNRLVCEIDKLSNFKEKGEISVESVGALISSEVEPNIFNLLDAITAKNKVRALELLYKELKGGRDPHYLLTMIAYQFRNLLIVKDLLMRGESSQTISKKAGLHPFVVRKSQAHVSQPEIRDLKLFFRKIASIDMFAKQGKIDIEDALYGLLLAVD